MLAYHFWIYLILTPDLAFIDLIGPVFLQGAASGLIFVPLMLFIFSSTPTYTGTTGLVMATYTRFIALLNSIAGFYNLQLYFNQYFKEGFLSGITAVDPATTERLNQYTTLFQSKGYSMPDASVLAAARLGQNLAQQTQLLSYRAIFMVLVCLIVFMLILIICVPAVNKTYVHFSKRMFTGTRNNLP